MKTMEKGFVVIFKWAIIVLFVVLAPSECRFANTPKREVTCSSLRLTINHQFEKPFKGMIYADGHQFDPACSYRVPPLSDVLQVTLLLSVSSCGTRLQFVPNGRSKLTNRVIIQQHTILRTSEDIEVDISCYILGLVESSNSSHNSKNNENPQVVPPKITSRLEMKSGLEVLGTKLASERQLLNKQLLVFRVPNSGRYNGIHIKNCVLHGDMILDDSSLFYRLTHPSGCQNTSTNFISAFSVVNKSESGDLLAYAKTKPFKVMHGQELYITCGAQLCRRTCRRRCARKKLQSDILTTIATHRLSKRSIDTNPDQSTRKQSDIRDRFLKSTIKALSLRLMRKVEEPKQPSDTLFEKRVLGIAEKENSTTTKGSADSDIPAYDVTNSEIKSSTIFPRDYELALLNKFNDTDVITRLKEYNYELPVVTTLPNSFPKTKFDGGNPSLKIRKELTSVIAMQSKKFVLKNEAFKKRLNAKKAISVIPESADSEYPTFDLTNSDEESSPSPNDYDQTLSTLDESDGIAHFEMSDFEELPVGGVTTLSTSPLPEDPDVATIIAEVSEPNLVTEDPMKSLNKSVVKGYSINLSIDRSTELDLDYKSALNSLCVPRVTFLAVSIVLGFIIFTLTMLSCGMAMYIRKERKKHLIDNFLLYNFY